MTWFDYLLLAVSSAGIVVYLAARAEMQSRLDRLLERQYDRPFPSLDKKAKTVDLAILSAILVTITVLLHEALS